MSEQFCYGLLKVDWICHDSLVRLSTKGEYGLLALVDLALQSQDEPVQAAEIALRQLIPKQYLDQLLMILKRSGLVSSMRGRRGGYRLARPAGSITLLEAITALEGPLVNQNFSRKPSRRQPPPAWGALKAVWDEQVAAEGRSFGKLTLEEIAEASRGAEETEMYYI
jgi:Rrf2 family transcriptional regulator, cysteine metabolism repressor